MPRITVLAGTNGAGKSSIAGTRLREAGGAYFNPDEETRRILTANPGMALGEANGLTPSPHLVLELARGNVVFPATPAAIATTPAWAQPIVACAYQSRTTQPAIP